jgi:uncharacterized membrane protein YphA (DoxX/SURF4 family)
MTGDCHVRIYQRLGVKLPRPTNRAELSCALLLPVGFRTRWVALWAVPSFVGIVHFWLNIGGYWFTTPGAEFPIMWLCMFVLQIILGDGAYALSLRLQSASRE